MKHIIVKRSNPRQEISENHSLERLLINQVKDQITQEMAEHIVVHCHYRDHGTDVKYRAEAFIATGNEMKYIADKLNTILRDPNLIRVRQGLYDLRDFIFGKIETDTIAEMDHGPTGKAGE